MIAFGLLLLILGGVCGSLLTYVLVHKGTKGSIFLAPSDDDDSTYDAYLKLTDPNDLVNKTVIQIKVEKKPQ